MASALGCHSGLGGEGWARGGGAHVQMAMETTVYRSFTGPADYGKPIGTPIHVGWERKDTDIATPQSSPGVRSDNDSEANPAVATKALQKAQKIENEGKASESVSFVSSELQ